MRTPATVRDTLLLQHHEQVVRIAHRVRSRLPPSVDVDDLIGAGCIGLIEAIERFDPSRGVPFEPYARHRVHGAMLDALRSADWVPHSVRRKAQALAWARADHPEPERVADRLGVSADGLRELERDAEIRTVLSLDAPVVDGSDTPLVEQLAGGDDPEAVAAERQLLGRLSAALEALPEREADAIRGFYLAGVPLKDLGHQMGVTDSRVCQLCSQGVRRLRRSLAHAA